MLLPHAQTLERARSHVAVLADRASTPNASSAYEHVLIELDRVHGDDCPALDTSGLAENQDTVLATAASAIEALEGFGVEALIVELILAMLLDAYRLDIG